MYTSKKSSGLKELIIASACFGAIPLVAVIADGEKNPLLFSFVWLSCSTIGLAAYMYRKHIDFWSKESIRLNIRCFLNRKESELHKEKNPSAWNPFNVRSALLPVQQMEVLLLLWALRYVDSVVGAIIFECWPIFFALLMRKLNKKYIFTRMSVLMSILAFISVGVVIWSSSPQASISSGGGAFIFGIGILLFTIILALQDAPRYQQGLMLAKNNSNKEGNVIFLTALSCFVGACLTGSILLVLEVFEFVPNFTEPLSFQQIIITAVGTLIVVVLGTHANVYGTLKGKDLKVQIVRYSTPIFGVLFLVMLIPLQNSLKGLNIFIPPHGNVMWGWLIVGLAGITVANIVGNLFNAQK